MKNTKISSSFTKKQLLQLKKDGNKITAEVVAYILRRWYDYDNRDNIIKEVLEHGCKSGIVSEMIYYCDTLAFYNRNKEEINKMLYDNMNDLIIYDLNVFFKDWDIEDPLALETNNQNLLAWYGFEETMVHIASELEITW